MLTVSKLARPTQLIARQFTPVNGVMGVRFLETYSERQEKKGRFVSPHVQIYKFPTVALSSITNRVTGVILTGGITALGGLSLAGVDVYSLANVLGNIPLLGYGVKFGVAFPLIFHYLGGVRHFLWDKNPELLTNEQVEKSSKALFAIAGATSALVTLL